MEEDENRISFIKDVEIKGGKTDTTYSALINETEKCGGAGFGTDGASVIIGHTKVESKIKRENTKIISIHCTL